VNFIARLFGARYSEAELSKLGESN